MPLDATTAITIGGVQCWDNDAEEDMNRYRSEAVRHLTCAWSNRMALMAALLGGSTQNGVIQNTAASARYPDATWLRADSIATVGEGIKSVGPNGMVAYTWAHLTVRYKTSDISLLSEEIGTLSIDVRADVLMPSQNEPTFKWSSDNKDLPVEATPGIPIPIVEFVKARRNMAAIPMALILSLVDHVNSSSFEGAAAGKVLYHGARSEATITSAGVYNFDLAHRFTYHPYGHNKMLRPSTGAWENIVTKTGSNPPHPTGDLNALFL